MVIKGFKQADARNFAVGDKARRIHYLVVHYVGATGSAQANLNYYANNYVGASAHYYVDFNGDVYQSVLDKDVAWHCGTKNGYRHPECRNSNSLGIEMCVRVKENGSRADTSKDWYFEDATVAAAEQLVRELMVTYNVPADRVIRHHDVTGKICPNPYVYNHTKHTWNDFKASLMDAPKKSGWVQENSNWKFYLGNTGQCIRNDWYHDEDSNKWYWFDGAGNIVTNTWYQYKDKWFYLGSDGAMLQGLQTLNGEWYYFFEDGEMATNPVVLTPAENGALQYPGLAK